MTTTVTVGGVSLSDRPQRDADGCRWVLSRLTGWHGGVGVRAEVTERPNAHGSFAERAYRGGRTVVVEGWVTCPNRATAVGVVRSLTSVLADGGFGDLVVDDSDEGSLRASVQLGGEPTVDWTAGTEVAFQGIFYAPDPLRYGPLASVSTGFPVRTGGLRFPLYSDGGGNAMNGRWYGDLGSTGRVSLSNEGTADSWPQFQVAGPVDVDGFEVVEVGTGRRLVYEGQVPAASDLVIDSATGTVVMDGHSDRTLAWAEFSPVPAGGSAEWVFLPRGGFTGAVLTVGARPAYW